jgi:DDE superfamily endonuclease
MLEVWLPNTIWPVLLGVLSCLVLCLCIVRPSLLSSSPRPAGSFSLAPRRRTFGSALTWSCFFRNPQPFPTRRPQRVLISIPIPSVVGGNAGPAVDSLSRTIPGGGASRPFPPLDRAIISSIACDVVARTGNPLSRQSTTDLTRRARDELNKPISPSTVWRILDEDAIKPWQYEHWIFPRASNFFEKAAVVLDLYEGYYQGERVDPFDRIISSDEKTSIQARVREHATLGPAPSRRRRVEAEYGRGGALQYLAAWDVQQGLVMGLCEATTGIEPFGRLVQHVMGQPEYASANHVFWVVDNGSSHRGEASVKRMSRAYPNAILVHTPVHASWLNQVEVYFSILQRKVLTPNDSADLQELEWRIKLYEELTNGQPKPFDWRFTKYDLFNLLQRLAKREALARATATGDQARRAGSSSGSR